MQLTSPSLFNNSVLSDVTIKQIHDGKVREYSARKAVLCADSSYFLRAFTGGFRESSENVMEIHDDDPDQFEFLIKYLYTFDYDEAAIDKLPGDDSTKRMLFPIGLHALTDKYDILGIRKPIAEDLRKRLNSVDDDVLYACLVAHYKSVVSAGGPLGRILTAWVLKDERSFMYSEECKEVIESYATFGTDMAVSLVRNSQEFHCHSCNTRFIIRRDTLDASRVTTVICCPYCKRKAEWTN